MQPTDDAMKRDLQDSWARSNMAVVPGCPQPDPDGERHHHTAEGDEHQLGLRGHGRSRLASAAPLAAAEVSVPSLFPSEPGRAPGLDPLPAASSPPDG